MPGIYKVVRIVGTSPVSGSDAVKAAVDEASKTLRHMAWFEVLEERGRIEGGEVKEFQVTLNVGFRVER